jgi:hypothetical protein
METATTLPDAFKVIKSKHAKRESSKHKQKHSQLKKSHLDANGREPGDSVPLTIQISSEKKVSSSLDKHGISISSTQGISIHQRRSADGQGDQQQHRSGHRADRHDVTAAASEPTKKIRKKSKHSSMKKRKRSERSHAVVDFAELPTELRARSSRDVMDTEEQSASIFAPAPTNTKSSKRHKRKHQNTDPTHMGTSRELVEEDLVEDDGKARRKFDKKRLLMWADLLGERPPQQDDDSMSRWLMNVLAVSDPKAPLKTELGSSLSSSSSSMEGAVRAKTRGLENLRRSDSQSSEDRVSSDLS